MTLEADSDKDVIETVQVALRIRPLVDSEISRGCQICVETVPGEPQVQVKEMAFTYNHVFPPEVSQEKFYNDSIKGIVKRLQKGYNVTILAYGQTGSGKTYSMGTAYSNLHCESVEAGVIPRAVSDIFNFIDDSSDAYNFKVRVSFLELYQEQLYDLLSNKSRDQSIIDIREENRVIVLPGLTEEVVESVEETMKCLIRGSNGRATGATAMNSHSSRSHAIFTVHIFKENKENRNLSTSSKFHLVDLAGSERSKKTKATGDRFREGVKINQGLLALGNVISALGDGSNRGFVGYRDSKLTRLLQDSLGGNSMTLMIACVSPADYNLEETVSTLRYADRARHIRNKPIINQDPKAAEILRLNNLVQQLRLQVLNEGCGISSDSSDILIQLQEEKRKNAELWEKYQEVLNKNKKLTCELQKSLNEHTSMIEKVFLAEASKDQVEKKLCELQEECNQTIEHLKELGNKTETSVNEEAYTSLCKMRSKILDLQSEQKHCSQMISKLADDDDEVKNENGNEDETTSPGSHGMMDESMNEKEEAHALNQAAKNSQLMDLMKSLNKKMHLAAELSANNRNLDTFNENVKESESKIIELEKEKEKLLQQLKSQQKSKLDPKTIDERKFKIQQLESEINELKKKCQHQANLIKMKEKNDLKITQLTNEIQQMKSAKVRLVRNMRAESERFRVWKLQNEKRIVKLCNQDRKLQSDMVKMENKHTKLQNVLKRRVEEAVSANKRLKEALERQKNAQRQRSTNTTGKEEVVQHWINEELELKGSLALAEHTLKGLMDDRGTLTAQLKNLKAKDPNNPNIKVLQEDIQLRNAQISDLQQKILAGNQENKTKNKWDSMHSMVEAKSALKYLFEVATEAKCEMQLDKFKKNQENINNLDLKEEIKKSSQRINVLEDELEKENMKHQRQLAEIDKQYEEKITTLIKQLNSDKTNSNNSSDNVLLERLKILQDAYDRALDTKDKLETENSVLRIKNKKSNSKIRYKKRGDTAIERKSYKDLWNDSDEGSDDSESKDPNWALTPLTNRKTQPDYSSDDEILIPTKRSSDGQPKCTCKTNCSRSRCGCRKLGAVCNSNCKCKVGICLNRELSKAQNSDTNNSGDLSESNDGSSSKKISKIDYEDVVKKQVRFGNDENDSSVMNREKKKRSFFYPDE